MRYPNATEKDASNRHCTEDPSIDATNEIRQRIIAMFVHEVTPRDGRPCVARQARSRILGEVAFRLAVHEQYCMHR